MGDWQGYVKIQDNEDSARHLIRINQFNNYRNWSDKHVYDFQNNEVGFIKNGKYEKARTVEIPGVGPCYYYSTQGKLELYPNLWFLEYLKSAAAKHINKTNDDVDLIVF